MADVHPRRVWPTLPAASSGRYLAAAHGAFLAAVFDYYVYLSCIRAMGRPQVEKSWNFAFDPITTSPVLTQQDVQARLLAPPHAAHVVVGVQYQASPYGISAPDLAGLGSPPVMRIEASLLTYPGGLALDVPGMRWDYGDGTLPATVRVAEVDWVEAVVNPGATVRYPPRWVFSGVDVNLTPPVTTTRPRPLNVGSGTNALVKVRFQTNNARLLRTVLWIRPQQVVTV